MPDFRVRFVGDLGNLSAFTSAIRAQTMSTARALESENARLMSKLTGTSMDTRATIGKTLSTRGSGLIPRVTWEMDSFNRSFRASEEILRSYVKTYETAIEKVGKTGKLRATLRPVAQEESMGTATSIRTGNTEEYLRRYRSAMIPTMEAVAQLEKQFAEKQVAYTNKYLTKIQKAEAASEAAKAAAENAKAARIQQDSIVKTATGLVKARESAVRQTESGVNTAVRRLDRVNRMWDRAISGATPQISQSLYGLISNAVRFDPKNAASFLPKGPSGELLSPSGAKDVLPWFKQYGSRFGVGPKGGVSGAGYIPTPAQQVSFFGRALTVDEQVWLESQGLRSLTPITSATGVSKTRQRSTIGEDLAALRERVENRRQIVKAAIQARTQQRTLAIQDLNNAKATLAAERTTAQALVNTETATAATYAAAKGVPEALQTQMMTGLEKRAGKFERSPLYKRALHRQAAAVRYTEGARLLAPPLPADVEKIFGMSPQFRGIIEKELGLATPRGPRGAIATLRGFRPPSFGTPDYLRQMAANELEVTSVTRNLGDQLTRVQGQFKGADGVITNFSTSLDKNGRVIEGFGRRFGAMGGILRQTAYDFRKVIEWTVATTVIFSTFGAIVGSIRSINELNKDLERFAITSRTTGDETIVAFKQIAAVAYETATPLAELVTAADDIALATRRTGQTTEEWNGRIVDLTRAVGILTNLTGGDTVSATEKLTAVFKQLNQEPSTLINVLNKVTAVAGGNAESINDIITALSLLTQAASQAQMSLDQQIASIQVISQATGKTADETATAFKNLFGAILNPISIKTLKEFGINVKDSAGNMRPFLTIYREVQTAIETGGIPSGRVQEVVRAMAGGPRRAPDAAALLSNIFKVFETVPTSVNATNEALIANSKILDTNAAKLQQIATLWDTQIFLVFNETVQTLTRNLADFAIILAQISTVVPTPIIQWGVQLGIMAVAGLAAGKAMRALGFDIGITTAKLLSFTRIGKFATNVIPQTASFIPVGGNIFSTREGILTTGRGLTQLEQQAAAQQQASGGRILPAWLGGKGGRFAIGAGAGVAAGGAALAGSATGGFDLGTAAGLLTMGGAALSFVQPEIGIGLMAAGTLLNVLYTPTIKLKDSLKDIKVEVYEALQAWKLASGEVKTQSELVSRLDKGIGATAKGTDENTQAVKAWVDAVLELNSATREQEQLWNNVIKLLPRLDDNYSRLVDLAKRGLLGPKEVSDLTRQLSADILSAQGKVISTWGESGPILPTNILTGMGNAIPRSSPEYREFTVRKDKLPDDSRVYQLQGEKYIPRTEYASLRDYLTGDLNRLKDYFRTVNGELEFTMAGGASFKPSALNVETFSGMLQQGIDAKIFGEEGQKFMSAFGKWVETFGDAVANLAIIIQAREAWGQAALSTGLMTSDQYQYYSTRTQMIADLQTAAALEGPARVGPGKTRPTPVKSFIDRLQQRSGPIYSDEAQQYFTYWAQSQKDSRGTSLYDTILKRGGNAAIIDATNEKMQELGYTLNEVTGQFEQLDEEAEQALLNLTENVTNAVNSAQQSLGGDLLKAKADLLGGLISQGDFNKIADQTNKYTQAIKDLGEALPTTQEGLNSLAGLLSANVLGFQGVDASAQGIIGTFLNIGSVLNLTGENFVKFSEKLILLVTISEKLRKLNNLIQEDIYINTQGQGGVKRARGPRLGGGLNSTRDLEKELAELWEDLREIAGTGRGTTPPKTGGASKPAPGEIYLDEAVTKRGPEFVKSFVAQAVKDAAKIQSQIPGADKKYKDTLVAIFNGLERVLLKRGIAEEYLTRAINENTEELKKANETKADTINRIRVGYGSFAALANVPMNAKSGISVGGPQGPITISLNINGQVLTPAQWDQIIGKALSELKSAISAG